MIPDTFIEFYGDQTRWFLGQVIDIDDPLYLGRIKVHVFGVHDTIKDEDLPWAQTVVPITQGGTEGRGNNLGIQVDAQVFGVFLDGPSSQLPLILGSIPRFETTVRVNERNEKGDPKESTVRGPAMTTSFLALSGTEREDRHFGELKDDIKINQEEVSLRSDVEYPHNKVYETEGVDGKIGHIKEYDDTRDHERIHERHSSGTFYHMGSNGELVTNIEENEYKKVMGRRNTQIGSSDQKESGQSPTEDLVVNGTRRTYVVKDDSLVIGGDHFTVVVGNDEVSVTGNVKINVTGNALIAVKEDVKVTSAVSIDLSAPSVTVRGNTVKLNS